MRWDRNFPLTNERLPHLKENLTQQIQSPKIKTPNYDPQSKFGCFTIFGEKKSNPATITIYSPKHIFFNRIAQTPTGSRARCGGTPHCIAANPALDTATARRARAVRGGDGVWLAVQGLVGVGRHAPPPPVAPGLRAPHRMRMHVFSAHSGEHTALTLFSKKCKK